ncbi:MAG: hypothetical protein ACRD11_02905 [Terriglobia bacterium]
MKKFESVMLSAAKHLLLVENKRAGFLALLGMTSLADFFTASKGLERREPSVGLKTRPPERA